MRFVLLLVLAGLSGCASTPRAAPVEPEKARAALKTTLDSWKAGKTMESLKDETPSIIAQDLDWIQGAKLLEYQILGDGTAEDANLRVPAQLTIRDKQGKESTKKVTYVVGTDPKLTVFRAME